MTSRSSIEEASVCQDAVVYALGAASLRKRRPALTIGMHNIIMVSEAAGVSRLVFELANVYQKIFRRSGMIGVNLQIRPQKLLACWPGASARRFDGHEDHIQTSQTLGIVAP